MKSKEALGAPAGRRASRVTMTMVARAAGVSQSTVSMVLTGRSKDFRIKSETADKVWSTAHSLGYRMRPRKNRPVGAPAFLTAGRGQNASATLGVVFVEFRSLSGDILYSPAYLGLCNAAMGHEIRPCGAMGWEGLAAWVDSGGLAGCGGVVLFSHRDPPAAAYAPIENLGVPWILMNRDPAGLRVPKVLFDAYGMAHGLLDDLLQRGHRVIGCLGTDRTMPSANGQRAGYRDALKAAGCYDPDVELQDCANLMDENARVVTFDLLKRRPDITALFAYFDWGVQGIYQGAREAGRRIPQDLSIVATGGQPVAQRAEPVLTTIRYPMKEMGEAAFRLLEKLWRGEQVPERTVIPGELLSGGSVGPPPGTK